MGPLCGPFRPVRRPGKAATGIGAGADGSGEKVDAPPMVDFRLVMVHVSPSWGTALRWQGWVPWGYAAA